MAHVRIAEQDLNSIDVVGVCTLIMYAGAVYFQYIRPKCKVQNVYIACVGRKRPSPHNDRTSHLAQIFYNENQRAIANANTNVEQPQRPTLHPHKPAPPTVCARLSHITPHPIPYIALSTLRFT